jgi:flavin reductase (DIM6/NTAB) family NADH-FMN oxidoreductase RutF
MDFDPDTMPPRDVYPLLIGAVNPRPIAWVSTVSSDGTPNLAPFSFFNAFGARPPCVGFSPALRRDGTKKDTLLNVEETGEFVVCVATEDTAEAMNATSAELPRAESEFGFAGLTPTPSVKVRPPRVAESPVAMECRLQQIIRIGDGPLSTNLILGVVVLFHFDDRVLTDGKPDPRKLRTLGRLGADWYTRAADGLFELPKPPPRR